MVNRAISLLVFSLFISKSYGVWNSPYSSEESDKKILYSAFFGSPKHLDPARSYSSDEFLFIDNIYEPPLQYHYLKRPYQLIPLTAKSIPRVHLERQQGETFYVYDIFLKKGIFYAPHPAFGGKKRELTATDYVFQIKRLADSKNHSPIASIMGKYIDGFNDYRTTLKRQQLSLKKSATLPLSGAKVISRYHYQIRLKQPYPQFKYWLAMSFFSPMPYEVIAWHTQQHTKNPEHLGIDWHPIGTGPFTLAENNPNHRMVLQKNPNFRTEIFPHVRPEYTHTIPQNTIQYNGKKLPLVDTIIFTLEKESMPYWQKFLQGYYDASGITSDHFDQALTLDQNGQLSLSEAFSQQGIQLRKLVGNATYFTIFNMLSNTVGGYTKAQKKLRQAISIALNYEQYIALFHNNRGIAAQGPIPPGIFGHLTGKAGINPWLYDWQDGKAQKKSIAYAKQLLTEAGYPNGINSRTGKQLSINYDTVGAAGNSQNTLAWYRRKLAKLNIRLHIRLTDLNSLRQKISTGKAELFDWGWNADYPDPENFLALLYSKNGKAKYQGENASNYANPAYDELYEKMLLLPNGEQRLEIIQQMVNIVREDNPWSWGWHPLLVGLYHQWVDNAIPHATSKNTLKYRAINPALRQQYIHQWNQPILTPLIIFGLLFVIGLIAILVTFKKRQNKTLCPKASC